MLTDQIYINGLFQLPKAQVNRFHARTLTLTWNPTSSVLCRQRLGFKYPWRALVAPSSQILKLACALQAPAGAQHTIALILSPTAKTLKFATAVRAAIGAQEAASGKWRRRRVHT
jgi:hypothetical protein